MPVCRKLNIALSIWFVMQEMLVFVVNKTCVDPTRSCNCDISEPKWHSDEGYYATPESLGITQMVFLQQKDLDIDAQGRITLGPLECVETSECSR
jgi:hypothetical protein